MSTPGDGYGDVSILILYGDTINGTAPRFLFLHYIVWQPWTHVNHLCSGACASVPKINSPNAICSHRGIEVSLY